VRYYPHAAFTAILHRKRCPESPQRARVRTTRVLLCHSCTSTVVNGSQRVVQVAEGVSGVPEWQHGEGGEAQDTHENVSTRSKYLPYRVCSLCSSARHVRAEPQMDEARDHLTERCLQLNDYHHDRITQLGIHQQQPESQELLPVAALLFDPVVREGLASHSCAAGLSQGHPHIAHYHTTTYQQLPPPQRETLHHAAQPLSTG
jgi:hypothetical protein